MKIVLNYDEPSAQVTDDSGMFIGTALKENIVELKEHESDIKKIIELKKQGFSAEEIINFAKEGII